MKVVGLNGRSYNININKFVVQGSKSPNKSQYHLKARKLLREMYPYVIMEEVSLPGVSGLALYMDFLVPSLMMGVEVHGRQHYEFVPHFHKNKSSYLQSRRRDAEKKQWCEHNDIVLVELKYSDDEETWRQQIEQC